MLIEAYMEINKYNLLQLTSIQKQTEAVNLNTAVAVSQVEETGNVDTATIGGNDVTLLGNVSDEALIAFANIRTELRTSNHINLILQKKQPK